jgi:hypothetical protein
MIIRQSGLHGKTPISRSLLQDHSLSFAARGMLCYLLSHPDSWEIRLDNLEEEGSITTGQRRQIMREAEAAGYLERIRTHTAEGHLEYRNILHEAPLPHAQRTRLQSPRNRHLLQMSAHNLTQAESSQDLAASNESPYADLPYMVKVNMVIPEADGTISPKSAYGDISELSCSQSLTVDVIEPPYADLPHMVKAHTATEAGFTICAKSAYGGFSAIAQVLYFHPPSVCFVKPPYALSPSTVKLHMAIHNRNMISELIIHASDSPHGVHENTVLQEQKQSDLIHRAHDMHARAREAEADEPTAQELPAAPGPESGGLSPAQPSEFVFSLCSDPTRQALYRGETAPVLRSNRAGLTDTADFSEWRDWCHDFFKWNWEKKYSGQKFKCSRNDGMRLSGLLKAQEALTWRDWRAAVHNYFHSEGLALHTLGDLANRYTTFRAHPLNRFKQPQENYRASEFQGLTPAEMIAIFHYDQRHSIRKQAFGRISVLIEQETLTRQPADPVEWEWLRLLLAGEIDPLQYPRLFQYRPIYYARRGLPVPDTLTPEQRRFRDEILAAGGLLPASSPSSEIIQETK